MLEAIMLECGLEPAALAMRQIITIEEARLEGFTGSPTMRVNLQDVVPTDEPPALACRVYCGRDGKISALPEAKHVKEAVTRAVIACRVST